MDAFDEAGDAAPALRREYGLFPDRSVSCKLGALDFLNDARFSLPIDLYMEHCRRAGRPAFRFLVDQPNPWQTSSRAHHGVDLLYLFGGFDLSCSPGATRVASTMQDKWIEFVCGLDPWEPGTSFAFGPHGQCGSVDADGLVERRRQQHVALLADMGLDNVERVAKALAFGRSSLLN